MSLAKRVPWLDLALMAAIGGAFLATVAAVVPWHMDEFLGYHMLACKWYPGNMANTFRSSCTELGLAPWGDTLLPLRAYTYTGSLPGLLYLPIFALWSSPLSARLLGVLAIAAQALLLHRLFGIRSVVNFVILLTFLSYSAIQVFDLGPISLQLTLLVAIYLALERWRGAVERGGRDTWLFPLAIGLMAFVGVWNKVSFFFVVPSLCLVVLAAAVGRKRPDSGLPGGLDTLDTQDRLRAAMGLLVGAAAFAGPTLLLLFSRTATGMPYYRVITDAPVLLSAASVKAHFTAGLLPFLLNPLRASHLIMNDPRSVTAGGLALAGLISGALAWGLVTARKRRDGSFLRASVLVAGWALSVALVATSGMSHAAHHVHIGLPFLVLAGYELLAPLAASRLVRSAITVFVLLNCMLYFQFTELRHTGTTRRASRELVAINAELNERFGEDYLIVCLDWGLYYFKSLYGPREQAVVHFWGLKNPRQLRRLQATADRLGRKLVFLAWNQRSSRSDWDLVVSGVEGLREERPAWEGGRWRLAFEPRVEGPD